MSNRGNVVSVNDEILRTVVKFQLKSKAMAKNTGLEAKASKP